MEKESVAAQFEEFGDMELRRDLEELESLQNTRVALMNGETPEDAGADEKPETETEPAPVETKDEAPEPEASAKEEPPGEPEKKGDEDPNGETWKHRYQVLQGMHVAKERELAGQADLRMRELEARMEQRLAAIEEARKKADAPPPVRTPSESDIVDKLVESGWDEEVARQAVEANTATSRRIVDEAVASIKAEIVGQIEPVRKSVEQQAAESNAREWNAYLATMDKEAPGFVERGNTPEFKNALESIVPGGYELLVRHHQTRNAPAVLSLFNLVELQNQGSTPAKPSSSDDLRRTMASQAQPATRSVNASGGGPSKERRFTAAERDRIYSEIEQGLHSDERATELMAMLRQAMADKRIDG